MRFPLVLDVAADGILCRGDPPGVGLCKQTFDRWKAEPVSQRDRDAVGQRTRVIAGPRAAIAPVRCIRCHSNRSPSSAMTVDCTTTRYMS